jgi:DNA polymerase III alpha subunit
VTIPLFKSHYSIGKSILTLNSPGNTAEGDAADSVFDIVSESSLDKIVLVEDTFMGFLQAKKIAADLNIHFIFGLRLNICDSITNIEDTHLQKCSHKIIIFPRNAAGCANLNNIYTDCNTKYSGWLDFPTLESLWDESNLTLAIPFYDSFIFKNLTSFNTCVPSFPFTSPTFFIENNNLPFDSLVEKGVMEYCKSNQYPTQSTQSIYYKNKKDFSAYLTYKLVCSRNTFSGRAVSIENPNMDHMGSDEFCWESHLEKNESL